MRVPAIGRHDAMIDEAPRRAPVRVPHLPTPSIDRHPIVHRVRLRIGRRRIDRTHLVRRPRARSSRDRRARSTAGRTVASRTDRRLGVRERRTAHATEKVRAVARSVPGSFVTVDSSSVFADDHPRRAVPAEGGPRGPAYPASGASDFAFAAFVEVDDRAGLETYLSHPVHAALGQAFNAGLAAALIADYDVRDAGEGGRAFLLDP
jgi:hypothetical protein